ncbi:conserved hypothetical protein [Thiocapsa sp. KS1]|nr:conserved hypothetical protein [Thiocapsa sp. KS1]
MFPAPAGMNRHQTGAIALGLRVPRARGDEPDNQRAAGQIMQVFPAPAGMNRANHRDPTTDPGVPRARGDEPPALAAGHLKRTCSPRPRG